MALSGCFKSQGSTCPEPKWYQKQKYVCGLRRQADRQGHAYKPTRYTQETHKSCRFDQLSCDDIHLRKWHDGKCRSKSKHEYIRLFYMVINNIFVYV